MTIFLKLASSQVYFQVLWCSTISSPSRPLSAPYFVTEAERNLVAYDNPRLLLVDKKIASARSRPIDEQ